MEIRRMEMGDIPAFAELYNAAEAHDPEFITRTPDDMRKRAVKSPGEILDSHFGAFVSGRMVVGGGGHFTPEKPDDVKAYFHFYVDPKFLGSDAEREVFDLIRASLKEKGASTIDMRANIANVSKVQMLKRLGFRENSYQRHHMERSPHRVAEPTVPPGYTLRNARMPDEMVELQETNNEAYSTRNFKPTPFGEFSKYTYLNDPESLTGLFVIERNSDGRIVGWVASQVEHTYNALHGRKRGGSYALVVIPSERAKGIGQALMKSSLRWIASKNMDVAYLGVNHRNPDAMHLYKSLGYELVGIWQGYETEL